MAIFYLQQMTGLHIKKKHYYNNMKKLITIIFATIFFTGNVSIAESDLWDHFGDQNVYGQKAVSDEEFDKALESKLKKRKKRDKNIPKGNEFHQSNETEFLKDTKDELPILCIPADLKFSDNVVLPTGHYQVIGEKRNGKPYLKFYQAHYMIAEIPAQETQDDFNEDNVHFVRLIENGEKQVKIIFGSIDFNAYSIINIAE